MGMTHVSNEQIKAHISRLPPEAREDLFRSMEMTRQVSTGNELVGELSRFCANSILNTFRANDAEPCSYLEMLQQAQKIIGSGVVCSYDDETFLVDGNPEVGFEYQDLIEEVAERMEKELLGSLFAKIFDNMSPAQRDEFLAEVGKRYPDAGKSVGGLATATGAMVLANLGGFSTYMAMSSLLSTLSFGALGFGVYATSSSILSVVLGPVGWAALGAAAVHHLGKPDENKLLRSVAALAMAAQSVPRSHTEDPAITRQAKVIAEARKREEAIKDEKIRQKVASYQKSTGVEALFRGIFLMSEGLIGDISDGVSISQRTQLSKAAEKLNNLRNRRKTTAGWRDK